jgi:hypothetical protein
MFRHYHIYSLIYALLLVDTKEISNTTFLSQLFDFYHKVLFQYTVYEYTESIMSPIWILSVQAGIYQDYHSNEHKHPRLLSSHNISIC